LTQLLKLQEYCGRYFLDRTYLETHLWFSPAGANYWIGNRLFGGSILILPYRAAGESHSPAGISQTKKKVGGSDKLNEKHN